MKKRVMFYKGEFIHVGLQDATVGGDMLYANRATLWRTNC